MQRRDQQTAEGILFTDQYQLSMAQLYYRLGLHEKQVQFDHYFRTYPNYGMHQAGYCINAGLEGMIEWMKNARFRDEDVEHLRSQTGRTGLRGFEDDFLAWTRGAPQCAPDRRSGTDGHLPDSGDFLTKPPQLPDSYCDQGRPNS